jgi:chromosomal replication initiator protein
VIAARDVRRLAPPIALGGFDAPSGTLFLNLPSKFMADWVQSHHSERLALAWRGHAAEVRQIRIGVGPAAPLTAAAVQIPARPNSIRRRANALIRSRWSPATGSRIS